MVGEAGVAIQVTYNRCRSLDDAQVEARRRLAELKIHEGEKTMMRMGIRLRGVFECITGEFALH